MCLNCPPLPSFNLAGASQRAESKIQPCCGLFSPWLTACSQVPESSDLALALQIGPPRSWQGKKMDQLPQLIPRAAPASSGVLCLSQRTQLCACLAVRCCLPVASISPGPHYLFPTSVLSCVLVSVPHGLNPCPFLAPGPQGFCLESQEGVAGATLALAAEWWGTLLEGRASPSASGLGTGWDSQGCCRTRSLFSLPSPSRLAAPLVAAGHLAGKVPPARLTLI